MFTAICSEMNLQCLTVPFNAMGAIVIVSVASLVEYEQAIYLWKVRGRRGRGHGYEQAIYLAVEGEGQKREGARIRAGHLPGCGR